MWPKTENALCFGSFSLVTHTNGRTTAKVCSQLDLRIKELSVDFSQLYLSHIGTYTHFSLTLDFFIQLWPMRVLVVLGRLQAFYPSSQVPPCPQLSWMGSLLYPACPQSSMVWGSEVRGARQGPPTSCWLVQVIHQVAPAHYHAIIIPPL